MILLPPSEGKTDAAGKKKLDLAQLSYPELNPRRKELLTALIALANGPKAKARSVLKISAKQDFEIARDQVLLTAPAGPAWTVYTGVLYDAIGVDSLSAPALKKLESQTFVVSALFGLISVADQIPAYRFSGDSVLPKIGSLTKFWGTSITELITKADEFVIDLRSGTYVNLGQTSVEISDQVVVPRIMQKMPTGKPKVVSHSIKATKGRLVRAMVQSKKSINSVELIADLAASLGADVEVKSPSKPGQPWGIDIIVEVL